MNKVCSVCSVEFKTNSAHRHTCSNSCYKKYWADKRQTVESKEQREQWKLSTGRYSNLKKRVKEKGFSYVMEEDVFMSIIKRDCFYCGTRHWGVEKGVGLDRIDNDEEYLESNVVSCCARCNRCRGNEFTSDEFKALMSSEKYIRALKIVNDRQKTKRTLEEFADAIIAKGSTNTPES
jgi:hypothetical protein